MRVLLPAFAFLLFASLALAGPNAGGVLVLHDPGLAYTSDIASYVGLSGVACGQDGPAFPGIQECPPYDPIGGASPCVPTAANPTSTMPAGVAHVWYVLAAFAPESCPRLKGMGFRIQYDESKVFLGANGPAVPESMIFYLPVGSDEDSRPFPANRSGVGLSFTEARTSLLQEVWWFAGYAYPGATDATFAVKVLMPQAPEFWDDSVPPVHDPYAGFGTLGLGGFAGLNPTPIATPTGACCNTVTGDCTITSQSDCQFVWLGAVPCNPVICPTSAQQGACCCPAPSGCTVTTPAACQFLGGVWVGAQVPCDPDPCALMPGACCNGMDCWPKTSTVCGQEGGVWVGPFTTCSPSPCGAFGACCNLQDGTCRVLSETACAQQTYLHAYSGGGTTCTPSPCPVPTGACCFADGSCVVLVGSACAEAGGIYEGGATTCNPNPCPQPGACCGPSGSCTVTLQAGCPDFWQGSNTTCSPNPCPQPGACCHPDGSCTEIFESGCTTVWQGPNTACLPNPCPPPGACCVADVCTVLAQFSCAGQWMGAGALCTPNPCGPTGACCFAAGVCMVRTWAQCAYEGGQMYMGHGTVCEPNPCPVAGIGDGGLAVVTTVRAAPNPFSGRTTLHLAGPPATAARVLIFDATGRLLCTAWEGSLDGREVAITWDGRDQAGRETPAGIYLVRVESTGGEALGRLVKIQ